MPRLALLVSASLLLSSCVTAGPARPPVATPRDAGPATAALLPWYTNDPNLSRIAYTQLSECLTRTGVFTFAPRETVEAAVYTAGVDLHKTFGPSDADFKAVGQTLKVEYVLGGAFTVLKDLTFAGWRKDITADMRLHHGNSGAEAGYWRSNTGFTWTDTTTALSAEKMSESAMNHMCAEISQPGAF
ncbi:hypothetical protein [Magnetovibrio sp.]|uniref:hypothetical protein n=1 Tax=Magnetovibrio sp. TaxID=2024836 RepID=UPI002F93629F